MPVKGSKSCELHHCRYCGEVLDKPVRCCQDEDCFKDKAVEDAFLRTGYGYKCPGCNTTIGVVWEDSVVVVKMWPILTQDMFEYKRDLAIRKRTDENIKELFAPMVGLPVNGDTLALGYKRMLMAHEDACHNTHAVCDHCNKYVGRWDHLSLVIRTRPHLLAPGWPRDSALICKDCKKEHLGKRKLFVLPKDV